MCDIKLSIIVATYCQEKYIEQALRSILMQKTDFRYEVLIGEDCSPDKTADVIRGLEKELPDYFHVFYRRKNLGEAGNNSDLIRRAKGDYLLFLEGDDYFLSEDKLQSQVDFLDNNPSFIAVAHNTMVVDANGKERTDFEYPECHNQEYFLEDFWNNILSGQTASLMFRNFYRDKSFPLLDIKFRYPGDQQRNFLLVTHGRVHCIQKKMTAYRYVPESGSSYCATTEQNYENEVKKLAVSRQMYLYAKKYLNSGEKVKICEKYFMQMLVRGVFVFAKGKIDICDLYKYFIECRYKISTALFILKWQADKRLFRRV